MLLTLSLYTGDSVCTIVSNTNFMLIVMFIMLMLFCKHGTKEIKLKQEWSFFTQST